MKNKFNIDWSLFEETSHSPALVDLVGEKNVNKVVDYCFIANPYYPNKRMMKDLLKAMKTVIKAYPSSNPQVALNQLAEVLGIPADYLILGNGATELITIIGRNFIESIAIPIPTFSEYIETLKSEDAVRFYQLDPNNQYQLNLNDFAYWIDENKIKSALIINPGNPTGQLLTVNEMTDFLERMKHLDLILLDESFIDFAAEDIPTLMPLVADYKNLLIIRSMSKHCGVPGLRLGYCCSSNNELLAAIKTSLPMWNINSIAEFFLTQLKETAALYHETRLRVVSDVQDLYQQLSQLNGFKVYPTGSNFIMLKITYGATAFELQKLLLERYGLYVRDCSNKVGLDNYHIRVSSQGKKKDKKLIQALKELVD